MHFYVTMLEWVTQAKLYLLVNSCCQIADIFQFLII